MKIEINLKCPTCKSDKFLVIDDYMNFGKAVICYNPDCSDHGGLMELNDFLNDITIIGGYTGEQDIWDTEGKKFHIVCENGTINADKIIKYDKED